MGVAAEEEKVTGETVETVETVETPAVSKQEEDDDPPLEDLAAPAPAPAPAPSIDLEDLLGPARPVVSVARPTATLEEVTDDEEEDDDDLIETERLQLQDQQKAQKTQMLLGPGAAS